MCLLRPSGHCVACGGDTQSRLKVRIAVQCHCGPRCRFVMAAQEEMRMRDPASHSCHPTIKWAQAHGAREALDRRLRLTDPVFYPAAAKPCLGHIGIEHKRAID